MNNPRKDLTSNEEFIDVYEMPLDEWLTLLKKPPRNVDFIDYEFPTDRHRDEYLSRIHSWSEEDVEGLIGTLLIPSGVLGIDKHNAEILQKVLKKSPQDFKSLIRRRYYRRLFLHAVGNKKIIPWEGNTWILDLLPTHPSHALNALHAYIIAHFGILPDGRFRGLYDVAEIIRARYIGMPGSFPEAIKLMNELTPRDFECLVERLYDAMEYETILTPAQNDGGLDILAERFTLGKRERVFVECKHYARPVGIEILRALLGTVTDKKVNKGSLVTTSKFTRGAKEYVNDNPRLEIISGEELCILLNEYLGTDWPLHIDRLVIESHRKAAGNKPKSNGTN